MLPQKDGNEMVFENVGSDTSGSDPENQNSTGLYSSIFGTNVLP